MSQPLPTHGFRFLQPNEIEALAVEGGGGGGGMAIRGAEDGYIFEVDFSYPQHENLRKRVQVELITDAGILRNRVNEPNLCRGNPINECLTAIQCTVATLKRPIYVGFSMLDLSKLHIYNFHYNHMCVKYPRHCQLRLLFTDTDSLGYVVQIIGIWQKMLRLTMISVITPLTITSIGL